MSKKPIGPSKLSLGLGDIPQSYQSKEQEARVAELLQQFYMLFEDIFSEISSPLNVRYKVVSAAEEKKIKEENFQFINAILSEEAKHHLRLISCVVNAELRVQLLQTFVGSLFNVSELRRFTRPARSAAKTLHNKKSSNGGKNSGVKKTAKAALWRDPSLDYAKKQRAPTKGRLCQLIEKFWKKKDIEGVQRRQLAKVVAGWIDSGEITLSTPSTDGR
jgi:hypothetical protein